MRFNRIKVKNIYGMIDIYVCGIVKIALCRKLLNIGSTH